MRISIMLITLIYTSFTSTCSAQRRTEGAFCPSGIYAVRRSRLYRQGTRISLLRCRKVAVFCEVHLAVRIGDARFAINIKINLARLCRHDGKRIRQGTPRLRLGQSLIVFNTQNNVGRCAALVIKTGSSAARRRAALAFWLNSRADTVVVIVFSPQNPIVVMLLYFSFP